MNTVDTDQLAERISGKCTVTKADIVGVITALIDEMKFLLQNSNAVKLDGFGTFKINLKTRGARTAKEFNVADNIRGFRVNFLPQGKKSLASGKMTRCFLEGVQVKRYGE